MRYSEHNAPDGDYRLNALSDLAHGQPFLFLIATAIEGKDSEDGEPGFGLSLEVGNGISSNQAIMALLFKTGYAMMDNNPAVPIDDLLDEQ